MRGRAADALRAVRARLLGGSMRPGTREYDRHARIEIEHYSRTFAGGEARRTLVEPAPAAWEEVLRLASERMRAKTGDDITGHVLARLRERPGVRLLSLGSGPGGVELVFAREAPEAGFVCMDLNAELLRLGRERAAEEGLPVTYERADLNTVDLPAGAFDLVFCHAALHHVIELERLAGQIERTLRPGGALVVVDVIARPGYRMWPETRKVARRLFGTLPEAYRLNHTAYRRKRTDRDLWEGDTRLSGMECVRSGDIVPALAARFDCELYFPYLAFARRFFDTMYGPNYDLSRPLDRALVAWIWELDCHYIESGRLRPESLFAIYRRRG